MSRPKTRAEKIMAQKRKIEREEKLRKIEYVKSEISDIETRIVAQKKKTIKQFHIRNLKIFAHTCNLVTPFVITAGITVGVFNFFSGGLPFHIDTITKEKEFHLDYKTDSYTEMSENYARHRWIDSSLPASSLVIYTPWEKQGEEYIRFKRSYDVDDNLTGTLFNAVMDENYDYIAEILTEYEEETQTTNQINPEETNDYFFEASLHRMDSLDSLKYDETARKNMVITIVEIIITLGIGAVAVCIRDFKFGREVERENSKYQGQVITLHGLEQELQDKKEKLLSLTNNMGGKK